MGIPPYGLFVVYGDTRDELLSSLNVLELFIDQLFIQASSKTSNIGILSCKWHDKIRQDSAPVAIEGKEKGDTPFVKLFQSLGKGIAPKKPEEYTRMRVRFYKAGINYQKAPLIFLGIKLFLMVSLIIAFLATRIMVIEMV